MAKNARYRLNYLFRSILEAKLHLNPLNLEASLAELFEGFAAAFAACANETSFAIGGTQFQCRSQFQAYCDTIRNAVVSVDDAGKQSCQILVAQAGSLGLPCLSWSEPYFREREVEAKLAPTRYRVHFYDKKGFWQIFDKKERRGIQLMLGPNGYPDWDAGSPLRNFIQWQLISASAGLVHAGALGLAGRGVLLAGAGGSGKSGSVLAGVLHGLQSVGDDYVLVEIDQDKVVAKPVFKTLKQDQSGLARLGLAHAPFIPAQPNWQGKYQFSLSDLDQSAPVSEIQVQAMILPKIADRKSCAFRKSTAKEAFLTLAPSGVAQIHGDRDATFALAAKLARLLPCTTLELCDDPAAISDAIRGFIKGLPK